MEVGGRDRDVGVAAKGRFDGINGDWSPYYA